MFLTLTCLGASPLLPNLRPGDSFTLSRVGADLIITTRASALMLQSIMTALNEGSLIGEADTLPDELVTDLRALMTPHLRMTG